MLIENPIAAPLVEPDVGRHERFEVDGESALVGYGAPGREQPTADASTLERGIDDEKIEPEMRPVAHESLVQRLHLRAHGARSDQSGIADSWSSDLQDRRGQRGLGRTVALGPNQIASPATGSPTAWMSVDSVRAAVMNTRNSDRIVSSRSARSGSTHHRPRIVVERPDHHVDNGLPVPRSDRP